MPIVRIGSKLVYFAHVPKCAGSAIEDYLSARFGRLGFLDRGFLSIPANERWNKCSPQHIDVRSLKRLMPPGFFDERFAVARHPVDRIVSVYRFQRDIAGFIPEDMDFRDWLSGLKSQHAKEPNCYDNHTRPAADLVPEHTRFFRLEDGLTPLVNWLDKLAGNQSGPRKIANSNTYTQRLAHEQLQAGPVPEVTDAERRIIEDIFAADFERFGYAMSTAFREG